MTAKHATASHLHACHHRRAQAAVGQTPDRLDPRRVGGVAIGDLPRAVRRVVVDDDDLVVDIGQDHDQALQENGQILCFVVGRQDHRHRTSAR